MDSGLRHKTPGEIGLRRLCPVHGSHYYYYYYYYYVFNAKKRNTKIRRSGCIMLHFNNYLYIYYFICLYVDQNIYAII